MEISGKYALADLSAELGVVMFICNTAVGKGIQANWLRVHGPLGTKAHLKWAQGVAEAGTGPVRSGCDVVWARAVSPQPRSYGVGGYDCRTFFAYYLISHSLSITWLISMVVYVE